MYILNLHYKKAGQKRSSNFFFTKNNENIPKWTILENKIGNEHLLKLLVLASCGSKHFPHLKSSVRKSHFGFAFPIQIETVITPHYFYKREKLPHIIGCITRFDKNGNLQKIDKSERVSIPEDLPIRDPGVFTLSNAYFLLAYGHRLIHHNQTDEFEFSNPFYQINRYRSLFEKSKLTDPVAFLNRLHYRSVLVSRYPAIQVMHRFMQLFEEYLNINTAEWFNKTCNFDNEWRKLHTWQKCALLPVLDATRHMIDSFPRSSNPIEMPGVILLSCPDYYCSAQLFSKWINLLDKMFPNLQFIVTVSKKSFGKFSPTIKKKVLPIPQQAPTIHKKNLTKLPKKSVLLIDVDSTLPNLALMKLSSYFKDKGYKVVLGKKDTRITGTELIYASCVFNFSSSHDHLGKLSKFYGDTLITGGSGIDIHKRLPVQIENTMPDYALYPELGDRAIGFITRGCPNHCPFCIVPLKEGKIRQVNTLESLLQNGRKKLILLDDNILAHPQSDRFLEEMVDKDIQVNFNQTLDIRLLDKEKANLLKRVKCSNVKFSRKAYHFSLNDSKNLLKISKQYQLMNFTSNDNAEFICMYGFDTTLSEDVERFAFLRSLPGAYVFVQEYQPINGVQPQKSVEFFDENNADQLIDKLVKIIFPQNMKSMEKYYRWLSMRYVETFGKIQHNLVDTLFRYNSRERKGRYLSKLKEMISMKTTSN